MIRNNKIISALFAMGYDSQIATGSDSMVFLFGSFPNEALNAESIKITEYVCMYGIISTQVNRLVLSILRQYVQDFRDTLKTSRDGLITAKHIITLKRLDEMVNSYESTIDTKELDEKYHKKLIDKSEFKHNINDIISSRLSAIEALYELIDSLELELGEHCKYIMKAIFEIEKIEYKLMLASLDNVCADIFTLAEANINNNAILEFAKIQQTLECSNEKDKESVEYQAAIMGSIFASTSLQDKILVRYYTLMLKTHTSKSFADKREDSEYIKSFTDLKANGNEMIKSCIRQLNKLKELKWECTQQVKAGLDEHIRFIETEIEKIRPSFECNVTTTSSCNTALSLHI